MKLLRYLAEGEERWGIESADTVQALTPSGNGESAALSLLRGDAGGLTPSGPVTRAAELRRLPPIASGATLYCIGLNYKAHVDETGRDLPPQPSVFTRTPASVVGAGEPIVRPRVSQAFDFEGELAMVIGRPGRYLREAEALQHVAGYTVFMDGSLRDYQKHSVTAGKNFWRSGACGPAIVLASAVPDPEALKLTTRLNDEIVQQSTTDLLIYSLARIVSYLSEVSELRTGEIIATGTPAGVGARRSPPLWMKAGDRISVEISSVGRLDNSVIDD